MTLFVISSVFSCFIGRTYWYNIGNYGIVERVQKSARQDANYHEDPLGMRQLQILAVCEAIEASIPQDHARFLETQGLMAVCSSPHHRW